jgi:hypothetical protein
MNVTTRLPDRLELRQRMFLLPRSQRLALWILGLMVAAMLLSIVAFALYKASHDGRDAGALLGLLLEKIARNPVDALLNTLLLVIVTVQVAYMYRAQRYERLILTPAGIEYRSPLPAALHSWRPSWSLRWDQIRGLSLKGHGLRGYGPQAVALELDAGTRKLTIFPYQWVDPDHYRPVSPWREMHKPQRVAPEVVAAAVLESAALRYLAAALPRLTARLGPGAVATPFALEKNPHTLALVIVFFGLLFYALGDTFFVGQETYAEVPPYGVLVACGVVAAVAAALWMRRGQVPWAENLFVALLLGGALGAAGYPGALRINALTDGEGLRKYSYQLAPQGKLQPLTPGLPVLAFPQYPEYWGQFATGSRHEFELRRGTLGFYQLDMRPVNEALRDFYRRKK